MTMAAPTLSFPATKKAISRSRVALRKINPGPYTRDDIGRFSEGGGSGLSITGSSEHGISGGNMPFPYGPSNNERSTDAELTAARHTLASMDRGGVPDNDLDRLAIQQKVSVYQDKLSALRSNRQEKLREVTRATPSTTPNITRPVGAAYGSESVEAAQARRRSEAERLQAAYGALNRTSAYIQAGGTTRPTIGDYASSADIEAGGVRYERASTEPGSATTLRQSLVDTTSRLARAAANVSYIAGNVYGVAGTSDYSRMGTHINNIQTGIKALTADLKALPADAVALRRELGASIKRLKAQADRLSSKINAKLKRKK